METIIYIGIFGIIMTVAFASMHALFSSNYRNETKTMVEEEGNFLLGKIDSVLSGSKIITCPSSTCVPAGMTGNKLSIVKFDGTTVTIELNGGNLQIDRGSGPQTLNNSNIIVTCTPSCFTHKLATGDGLNPENLEAKITLNSRTSDGFPYSQNFSTVKYLRK